MTESEETNKKKRKEYHQKIAKEPWRKEQLRRARKKWYLKKKVERPRFFKERYQRDKLQIALNHRKRKQKIKVEVLTHYGGGSLSCIKCGETRLPALSIDHINGRGTEERKLLGKAGYGFYHWLKKQEYPDGYQTLCMNCQFVVREERYLALLERRTQNHSN